MSSRKQIPTVSVVIPAYNEEAVIISCLHALRAQTVAPDEIIVVDNNSSDSTAALVDTVDGVRLIRESRQGIAYARNAGFNTANSDIIARIDADTIVPSNWLETIVDTLAADNRLIGISGPARFYDHPYGRLADFVFNSWNKTGNRMISGSPILWGSNMAFRRSAWLKVRTQVNNDSRYWEDIDLSMRVLPYGEILYDKRLYVHTSARSSLVPASGQARYFSHWPRTYSQFGFRLSLFSHLLFASLTVWLPLAVFVVPTLKLRESLAMRQQRLQRRLRAWLAQI